MNKPRLWITRKLSDNTEARAKRDYDVVLNPQDTLSSADDIVRMSAEVDAIIPCHSESFDADTVARLDSRVKIIANHSVGVDHCDLNALQHSRFRFGVSAIVCCIVARKRVSKQCNITDIARKQADLIERCRGGQRAVSGDNPV